MKRTEIEKELSELPGGVTPARLYRVYNCFDALTTGERRRFRFEISGDYQRRRRGGDLSLVSDRSAMIGAGGKRRGQVAYQVWAVWN